MPSSNINGNEKEKSAGVYDSNSSQPNLKGDWLNFFLLLLLYTMQGFPLGLTSAIPILLQSQNDVSYQDQALFSLAAWPFSLKLLWAPLVDALYIQRIGRRKSWLIPVQYLMGTCFLYMANDIDDLLPNTGTPNIMVLMCMFFISNFLAATQDIVVDSWALTMLKKNNVGHASTCNTTGQAIGVMLGSVFPILFASEDFCNKYLRDTPNTGGLMTMKSVLYVWGLIFICVTTLIAIFKKEKDCRLEVDHVKLNVVQNYTLLCDIIKLPSIRILAIALLTAKVGFSVTDTVTYLELVDAGVSIADITVINTAMYVVRILIPLVTAKYTSGPKPMSIYLKSTAIKLIWSFTFILLVYFTPKLIKEDGVINIPMYYYATLILILFVDEILSYIMFVAVLSFFSRISDPRFGGTYLTFLNTVTNLGVTWTSTVALGVIDLLTFKKCSFDSDNYCSTSDYKNECEAIGGDCVTTVDGFYLGTLLSVTFGFAWYGFFKNIIRKLQTKGSSHWMVNIKPPITENI
ncbi:acetyl-coenzyme A transporter 1 [Acyrthosiphon pisum]|uniref:Acetyl-coenzyme A transporter 1 n=1 Tax=Acyrthosiphon pisum TaxID=7029 RepID=A0A8R1W4J3_ACYPI|nr:acetyl-coenzyme A transporter 1 [Acyrthosiphon pisum]|eukprot:XP_001944982.1 PREDICTED: acetyl-coenzyme A transporter 1 [Acyrthosiphon pisum]